MSGRSASIKAPGEIRPVESTSNDRASPCEPFAWLAALPHPVAIVAVSDGEARLVTGNPAFSIMQLASWVSDRESGVWLLKAKELQESGRHDSGFDLRFDSEVGPVCYRCTMTRMGGETDGEACFLFSAIDRTNEWKAEQTLRRELLTDSLTALPNRLGFADAMELAIGDNPDANYAIIAIDVMRFSRINESLGPLAGDELIITLARRLKSVLRGGDVLARIGGNEFAIFTRVKAGVTDAVHVVERAQATLATPARLSHYLLNVECAIGCALADSNRNAPEDVLRQAQVATKTAKTTGRMEVYRPGALNAAQRRFQVENRLRHALDNGDLQLALQPLMRLDSATIKGFETLARWHDSELGVVSPAEFIPVAEESGLIVPLGRWVIHEATQMLARWDSDAGGPTGIGFNVNVSPVQLARDDVAALVKEALRFSGVLGSRLTVEVTESALVVDPDKARQLLRSLKDMDVAVAMDDFGTGFSNLANLQMLPIDVLKIDRSFVAGMNVDRDKSAIVNAIVSLAEALQMQVTAEGVETAEVADALARIGCGYGQGYYYAKPMFYDDAFAYWRGESSPPTA